MSFVPPARPMLPIPTRIGRGFLRIAPVYGSIWMFSLADLASRCLTGFGICLYPVVVMLMFWFFIVTESFFEKIHHVSNHLPVRDWMMAKFTMKKWEQIPVKWIDEDSIYDRNTICTTYHSKRELLREFPFYKCRSSGMPPRPVKVLGKHGPWNLYCNVQPNLGCCLYPGNVFPPSRWTPTFVPVWFPKALQHEQFVLLYSRHDLTTCSIVIYIREEWLFIFSSIYIRTISRSLSRFAQEPHVTGVILILFRVVILWWHEWYGTVVRFVANNPRTVPYR